MDIKSIIILFTLILLIIYNKCQKKESFTVNNIDKIYVINLKKNNDRLNVFMDKAKKANVNVERFEAVNGKKLPKKHPDIIKHFTKIIFLNKGQIGCALSHIKILEDAIKNNYKNIIVFEDDAIIPKDFWKKFNQAYKELPKNWDMLLLGINTGYGKLYSKHLVKLKKYNGNWGTMAYLINVKFMKHIVKNKFNDTFDTFLRNNYYYNKNFKIFLINPLLIKHDYSFYSDNFNRLRKNEDYKNNIKIVK
jgi:glycosyl transferase, family 25